MSKFWAVLSGTMIVVLLAGAGGQMPNGQASPAESSSALGAGSLRIDSNFGKMPLYFIPNQGQMDARVAYSLQGKDKSIYFTSEGLTYVLTQSDQSRYAVKMDFVGANAKVQPSGEDRTEAVISYFKGKPEAWKTGLPTYSRIVYKDLWPGIDVAYYGTTDRMKYEFVVRPGADPSRIRLAYRGANAMEVNGEGRLEVRTPAGNFEDDRPVAYQEIAGKRTDVTLKYHLEKRFAKDAGSYVCGFNVGAYDRTKPLVLDPAVLVYCGYIGGSGADDEYGFDIAVDALGNAYISGSTYSAEATFPVIEGPDLAYNGDRDAFVAKVNASGTALDYCGYIGGSGVDFGYGIAVDDSGNAYVSGRTSSTEATFPVVIGPDLKQNGGWDAFVAKVNASGTALVYCGFIGGGGPGEEYAYDIAVDKSGNAYVSGSTYCTEFTFPVTVGPDLKSNGGLDAFVAKVKADGTGLDYCGYIGGSGQDYGYGVALDSSGNAYVTGSTSSTESTFPVKIGPDLTHNGGLDAFVAKVNAAGTALVYCGYIGGSGDELRNDKYSGDIAVDSLGNAYVTGDTTSTEATFPVVGGPDLTYNGGQDAYVAKVKADGTGLVYCGYIGGSGDDAGWGLAVDGSGNAYLTGETSSDAATFPVKGGPDLTYNGGVDAFVAKVNPSGTLVYCGYLGGIGWDIGLGIAVDDSGNAYVTGSTSSPESTFPVVGGPDLTYNGGPNDIFVAKISSETITLVSPNGGEHWAPGTSQAIVWTTTGTIENVKLEYSADGGATYALIIASTSNTGTYEWTVPDVASKTCLVKASDAANEALMDVSDSTFSIMASAPLMLTSPAGGEAWISGSTQEISWLSSGVTGNLNIYLYKGTSNLGAIATGIPVSNGVYSWKAGYLKTRAKVAEGSNYRVSIVSAVNKKTKAISEAYFSLVKPKISVKAPASGTSWKINSIQRITWTYTAVSGTVNISLYRNGVLKGRIAESISVSDLGFNWTVGLLTSSTSVPTGTGYQVRVTTSDGKVTGRSRGTFTIRR
jgi:hypothetical protein